MFVCVTPFVSETLSHFLAVVSTLLHGGRFLGRRAARAASRLSVVYYARSNRCDRSRGRAPQTSPVAAGDPLITDLAQMSMCSAVKAKKRKKRLVC